MKKFFKLFAMALFIMVMAASCTSVRSSAPVMAVGSNNIITNVKADLDYAGIKKINGEATTHRVLWIFGHTPGGNKQLTANNKYKGLNKAERTALYRAKNAGDVDMVLEPEFDTETKSYFFGIYKKTKVRVKAWGANIKGFQDGTPVTNETVNFSNSIF